MGFFEFLILGIVQGLTEFLPVSSSGHLVVLKEIFSAEAFRAETPVVEVALHVGTLAAILAYYRRDVYRSARLVLRRGLKDEERAETRGLLMWIVVGTLPTVVMGLAFKDWLQHSFARPVLVGAMLTLTGVLCVSTRFIPRGGGPAGSLGVLRSLLVGTAQGLAIVPGISRSGATIVTAMALRTEPAEAGRFSFLLSVPAVAGAALLTLLDGDGAGAVPLSILLPGVLVSAVTGFLCLGVLTRILKAGNFFWFGFYCIPLGVFAILYFA